MPENVPPKKEDQTPRIIREIAGTMDADTSPDFNSSPDTPAASNDAPRRGQTEKRVKLLLNVTSADEAYDVVATAFTPPSGARGEALATWHYHAERARRQMIGAALGELSARTTVSDIWQHLDTHDSVALASSTSHSVRSPSLQNFVVTMSHWFGDTLRETIQTNDTAKALVEAGNRRRGHFRDAVINWVEYRRRRDPNFEWFIPPPDRDIADDITSSYSLNMTNELLSQFLVFGMDTSKTGNPPQELARQRIHRLPAFTSTVHEISIPVLKPFATYDPDNGINEELRDTPTLQTVYSAWERDPTPKNARAFLRLATSGSVKENLARTASFPGAGEDSRARNPGHCHIDTRIVDEEAFPVAPRALLIRLGQASLAELDYLNMSALVAGIGLNAATHTFYSRWPKL